LFTPDPIDLLAVESLIQDIPKDVSLNEEHQGHLTQRITRDIEALIELTPYPDQDIGVCKSSFGSAFNSRRQAQPFAKAHEFLFSYYRCVSDIFNKS
jgi:hypothetical protein